MPTNLQQDSISNSSITVTWSLPDGNFNSFKIDISPSQPPALPVDLPKHTISHEFQNLTAATTYTITLMSVVSTEESDGQTIYVTTSMYAFLTPPVCKTLPSDLMCTWFASLHECLERQHGLMGNGLNTKISTLRY